MSRDIQAAVDTAGGRAELAEELFQSFLDDLPTQLQKLSQHFQMREWHNLREQAHHLRGASAVCGLPVLDNLIKRLEDSADRQRESEAAELLAKIDVESDALQQFKPMNAGQATH